MSLPLEIDCRAVKAKLDAGETFVFLDCREREEFAVAKILFATLIPMSEISGRLLELDPHDGTHVIAYCHHGGRSLRVAEWLREHGFPEAQSMAGGIDQWSQEIDPTIPQY